MASVLRAVLWGLGGGLIAGTLSVLPALGVASLSGRVAGYAGLVVGLLVIRFGAERLARAGTSFGARLGSVAVLVTTLAAGVAGMLYLEFTRLSPGLLAARYAGYQALVRASAAPAATVAQELARLALHRAEYLSAGYQALSDASALFFFGMLLGAYGAWRERTRARWRAGPGGAAAPGA